jgi:hypothetical protein
LRATGRKGGRKKGPTLAHQAILTEEARYEALVRSADCHSYPDRREPDGVRLAPCIPLKSASLIMADDSDEQRLARSIIDVHGAEAATIVRGNARGAALAGQLAQAKSWIRVLGIIQRRQAAPNYREVG